jgi:hypothetical protein
MTPNPNISFWNPALWPNDPLYKEITNGTSGLQFFLGHHTFSHENLNNVTYNDAYLQLRLNQVRVPPAADAIVLFTCCWTVTDVFEKGTCTGHVASKYHRQSAGADRFVPLGLQQSAGVWNTTNGKFNRFSQTAMVTPAISGFRNVDALQVHPWL